MKSQAVWWVLAILGILFVLTIGLIRVGTVVTNFAEGYKLRPKGDKISVGSMGQIDMSTEGHGERRGGWLPCFLSEADLDGFLQDLLSGNTSGENDRQMRAPHIDDGTTVVALAQSGFTQIDLEIRVEDGSLKGSTCWIPNGRYFKYVRLVRPHGGSR